MRHRGLREGGLQAKEKGINNFPATCAALNSAIKKLRLVTKLPKAGKLYRGIMGMALPQAVLKRRSFVELAFSSATPNPEVAKEYAGSERSSIFEIQVGQIDRGAFIGEYSQYGKEEEHVLPPLSFFEIMSKRREFGINVYVLKLNVNLRTQTLGELREGRKAEALEIADKLKHECQQLTGHDSSAVSKIVETSIKPVGYEWFNQGSNFSGLLSTLEAAVLAELEEEQKTLLQAANALPEEAQVARVAELRKCVRLAKRCSAGDAEGRRKVLQAQERLVAAIMTPARERGWGGLDAAAADDLVELADQLEQTQSDYTRALEMLERALEIKQSLQPVAPTEVARIFHRTGWVLYRMERLDEALTWTQQALDVRVSKLGDHSDVSASHNNIALIHKKQGKFEEAVACYQKALEIDRKVAGDETLEVATGLMNLGSVFRSMGDFEKSLEHHQQSLDLKINLLGPKHEEVAKSQLNIGLLFEVQGKQREDLDFFRKAKQKFKQARDICRQVLGDKHDSTKKARKALRRVRANLQPSGDTTEEDDDDESDDSGSGVAVSRSDMTQRGARSRGARAGGRRRRGT